MPEQLTRESLVRANTIVPLEIALALEGMPARLPGETDTAYVARGTVEGWLRARPATFFRDIRQAAEFRQNAKSIGALVVSIPADGPPQFHEHPTAAAPVSNNDVTMTESQAKDTALLGIFMAKAAQMGVGFRIVPDDDVPDAVERWVTSGDDDRCLELSASDYDDPRKYAMARAQAIKEKKFLRRRGANL